MVYPVYSIYDRVTSEYGEPFTCVNEQSAIRRFDYLCSKSEMVSLDLELYRVAFFNSTEGVFTPESKPFFVRKCVGSINEQ